MSLITMTPFKTQCDRDDLGPPHPGEILREDLLPHYKLSVPDLGKRLGIGIDIAADLVAERISVDAALAGRLGIAFALCPRYWQALQLQYDLWHNWILCDGFEATQRTLEPVTRRHVAPPILD